MNLLNNSLETSENKLQIYKKDKHRETDNLSRNSHQTHILWNTTQADQVIYIQQQSKE